MAYEFEVVAWRGWDNRTHGGLPDSPQAARGLKVLLTNPDNAGDTHQFWTYTLPPQQNWASWWVLIAGISASHGMELLDEPSDDDGGGGGFFEPPDDDDDGDEPDEPEPPRSRIGRALGNTVIRIARWFRR